MKQQALCQVLELQSKGGGAVIDVVCTQTHRLCAQKTYTYVYI